MKRLITIAIFGVGFLQVSYGREVILRVDNQTNSPVKLQKGTKETIIKKDKSFEVEWSGESRLIYPGGTLKIKAEPVRPTSDLIKVEIGLMNEVGEVVQTKTNYAGGKANENLLINIQLYQGLRGATYRIDLENRRVAKPKF